MVILILSVRLIQKRGIDVCLVPTDSMENAIMAGDRIVVRKTQTIGRNDIIVFNHPGDEGAQLVKRCIGLPGDTVSICKGAVYVNGRIVPALSSVKKNGEDVPVDFPLRSLGWTTNNYGPVVTPTKGTVIAIDSVNVQLYRFVLQPKSNTSPSDTFCTFRTNGYFVLGDNRGNSLDSRYWGFVPEELIVGKVLMVYFSRDAARENIRWNRIGMKVK